MSGNGVKYSDDALPALPPMLSPTLPSWLDDSPSLPQRMLSPTLPSMFDEREPGQKPQKEQKALKADKTERAGQRSDRPLSSSRADQERAKASRDREGPDRDRVEKPERAERAERDDQARVSKVASNGSNGSGPNGARDGDKSESENGVPLHHVKPKRPLTNTLKQLDEPRRKKFIVSLSVPSEQLRKLRVRTTLGLTSTSLANLPARPSQIGLGIKGTKSERDKADRVERPEKNEKTDRVERPEKARAESSIKSSHDTRERDRDRDRDREKGRKKVSRSYSSSSSDEFESTNRSIVKDTKSSLLPSPMASSSTPHISTPDRDDQRDAQIKVLHGKLKKWMGIAKAKKHEADQASSSGNIKLAAALSFDSVFCFIIGFDYEDRADKLARTLLRPRSWYTLVPYMSQLVKSLDSAACPELVGLCYQIRAIIYIRIAQSYNLAIKKMTQERHSPDSSIVGPNWDSQSTPGGGGGGGDTLGSLAVKYISMLEASQNDFRRGFKALSLDQIEREFPKTWSRRSGLVLDPSKQDRGLRPSEDSFHLPLHCFSSIKEATAFGHCVTKEWAETNGIECEWALIKGFQ